MKLKTMCEQLIAAEMDFAHFNAVRTASVENHSGIQRETTEAFEYILDPTRPASTYYNRAIGRTATSLSEAEIDALPMGIVSIEVTPAQLTPASAAQLLGFGFQPAYQLCYLGVVPQDLLPVKHEVMRLEASHTDVFFDLLQLSGVDFPLEKRLLKRQYYCTERFQSYVAKTPDGTACAWSTMYLNGKVAFLGNSFTLPQYRQLGMQTALLAARLNAAKEMGVEIAYTDVEHGSQSHYNCEQIGFRTLTINTIWGMRA